MSLWNFSFELWYFIKSKSEDVTGGYPLFFISSPNIYRKTFDRVTLRKPLGTYISIECKTAKRHAGELLIGKWYFPKQRQVLYGEKCSRCSQQSPGTIIATIFPLLVLNRRKRGRNSRREKLIFGVRFDEIRRNSSAEIPLGTRLRRMHCTKSEATVFYDGCCI